jgi:uncharacterized protein (DUF342 family)
MATLEQLREYMRTQAEDVKKSIQVNAPSIEAGLEDASIQLGVPKQRLEFEILVKGSPGFMGYGKRDFVLVVYETVEVKAAAEAEADLGIDLPFAGEMDTVDADRPGRAIVRLYQEGVMLKVLPPVGSGKPCTDKDAVKALNDRAIHDFDRALVSKAVREQEGSFVRIGEFVYNPAADSILTVEIADYEMKAFVIIRPPGPGGTDLPFDTMITYLENNSVVHGVKQDVLRDLVDHPRYDEPVLIAEGTKPYNGKDARIIFNFETDRSQVKLKEKNGKVDFKEMNLVQNVVEGQALAKKVPAEQGENGRTVTGKLLPAKPGNDTAIGLGKNVRLSDDGLTVFASINGQVLVSAGKINVEPIYVVPGNVNLRTGGNVIFLGTVLVKGSVDDGFKVKAAGNIEVMGNVGKCELDAEGDVIVHQGITGKGGGVIRAGKGVWSKFIENASVEAGDTVAATDGIINSTVAANKRIICQGKRATIVGGKLTAAELIFAKTLGSVAGSETQLEVGYDPKRKQELVELGARRDERQKVLDEIQLNIHTLMNQKNQKGELPEEKEQYLGELQGKEAQISKEIDLVTEDIEEIQSYLDSLKMVGKVSASAKVFQGVRINIKDAVLDVRNEFKATTFINENGLVKVTKFEDIEEDITKRR